MSCASRSASLRKYSGVIWTCSFRRVMAVFSSVLLGSGLGGGGGGGGHGARRNEKGAAAFAQTAPMTSRDDV
jgi:hypothetical protein